MNKPIRQGSFFAKAEGQALSWKDRLAKLKGKAKPKATAKLEIDDANGETVVFPEIGDVSEIAEGTTVTATDGDHVFTADGKTYTVTVADGVVTAIVETMPEDAPDAETTEFVEAVALELEANETFRAEARAEIDALKETIKNLKATMSHKTPAEGDGDEGKPKGLKIAGKSIDLSKINLK
jgi:hypothetical protein